MQVRSIAIQPTPVAADTVAPAAPEDVGALFVELRKPLFRYLLSLSLHPAEAEDVVQETFLRLCRQFRSGSCFSLRSWVFRVAHNLALDYYRMQLRQPSEALETGLPDSQQHGPADSRQNPEQCVIERQRAARLHTALARLAPKQQYCLHLRAEGLRYREIAEVLGVGTSTVADWIQDALQRLGKELK
ncbi:MAG: sigma-70 family RNA polymerase sigma factor [Acidobacteria bacterium]|nr:sigma-70 family RNA polymerase sigma factor [Acidobacteriota bacterium]